MFGRLADCAEASAAAEAVVRKSRRFMEGMLPRGRARTTSGSLVFALADTVRFAPAATFQQPFEDVRFTAATARLASPRLQEKPHAHESCDKRHHYHKFT